MALLVVAGVVAGLVGSAGGITSLIAYPALLAVGLGSVPATVANLVAAVVFGPGSALTSRAELRGARPALVRLLPIAVACGALGAGLLRLTPPGVFTRIVPFLVAAGSIALLVQPSLHQPAPHGRRDRVLSGLLVGLFSVYSGFFGAGSGVMLLATCLLLLDPDLPRANALKNLLLSMSSVAAAAVFVLTGGVVWAAAVPLASGLLVGAAIGPVVVRRLPARAVRWAAALFGFTLAVELWLHPR